MHLPAGFQNLFHLSKRIISKNSLIVRLLSVRYSHAAKVWEFLRYDRSNRLVTESDNAANKSEQQSPTPVPTFGPVPLFKWPETKADSHDESTSINVNIPYKVILFY